MVRDQDVVLVTGATGRTGRMVVDELVRTGVRVRALTRRPELTSFPESVEVAAGDFTVPASLDAPLEGVAAVFLVWATTAATAADVIARIASRRRRIVYLSAPFRTPHPFFQQPNPLRELHTLMEQLLAESELDVAVLRPGMFASNALHWWAPQIRMGDEVQWPCADAETAPIDERDLAAVAARVLLDARHACGDYVLTGPESLSQAAQVHAIGDVIGRRLSFLELSPDEFRHATEGKWPPGVADMLLGAWLATRGHRAFVSSDVHDILGRPARTWREWALNHAASFARED